MKTLPRIACVLFCFCSISPVLHAQIPQLINYQGRVVVGTTNFDGSGQFKFALVDSAGTTTYWSNDGTSTNGSEPTNAVTLTVTNGLYSVQLGDNSITNMTALPGSVFTNSDVRLRVWFNDGSHGSQLLTPDQRLGAVGYAFMADNIKDGAITSAKLGNGAVTSANIANGAVTGTQLASGLTLAGTTTGNFSGNGTALTSLNASNITLGFLPVARLPATVALRAGGNNFTGLQTITGDGSMEHTQAATAGAASFMEFDDSTGGSVFRGIYGADGPTFSGATNQFTIATWTNSPLAFYTNQARRMTILSNGNVGIGTATPAKPLDVTADVAALAVGGSVDPSVLVRLTNSSNTGNVTTPNVVGIGFGRSSTQQAIVGGTFGNDYLDFFTGGALTAPKMRIASNGNVGIGTSTPTATLDVAGAINIPATTSATNGVIQMAGTPIISAFGSQNVFFGNGAGNFALTGQQNTGVGVQAAHATTGGDFNTAIGASAASSNTDGTQNTAIGGFALASNTDGSYNTATGVNALKANTGMSSYNTATGVSALSQNTTGLHNTAMGAFALSNSNGTSNIGIGNNAGQNITTGADNIDIGNDGLSTDSNVIRIGTADDQLATFIAGINGVTLSPSGTAVFINSNGQLGTINSSRRFKTDIKPMGDASSVLLELKPVTFRYKPEIDAKGIPQFGLIAEEVAEVCPDLIIRDQKGQIQTVRYEQVNAMLLNEFLKQHRHIAELEKEQQTQLAALREQNAALRAENTANAKRLAALEARDKERDAQLARIEESVAPPRTVALPVSGSEQ
jgi:Chaperone of endosialidase